MRIVHICFAVLIALMGMTNVSSAQSSGVVGKKYESYTNGNCVGVSYTFCYAVFPANPTTSVIEINLVSCAAVSNGLPYRVSLQIVDAQSNLLKTRYLGIANSVAYAGVNNFYSTINDETSLLMGVNRRPRILLEANGVVATLYCTISGTIVP